MSGIQQLEDVSNNLGVGSEQTNGLLDDPNLAAAIRKMLELQLQVMVFPMVKRIMGPMMETMVRKVVEEVFERAQDRFFTREKRKSGDEAHASQSQIRTLELRFLDKVCLPVYTGNHIRGEGGNSIKVVLVDPLTGNCVNSGPGASAKVGISVQPEGAYEGDINWTGEESANLSLENKGRRPLLSGNYLKLREGIAGLDKIKFKNISKWTKSCEVSLVARVVENLDGITVKEAKTESFLVTDCRSTLYKKHYPPSHSDKVWRLEKISRRGRLHKCLSEAKVDTVKEFLRSLYTDPQSLQAKLNVSAEKFKVIADHAQTCVIGENLYLYHSTSCERKAGVILDTVGRLQGLLDEQNYVPVDRLSEDEKVDARKMVVSAFEHWEDVQPFDKASLNHFTSQLPDTVSISRSPRIEGPDSSTVGICKTSTTNGNDFGLPSTSLRHLSPVYSFGNTSFDGYGFGCLSVDDLLNQGINYPIHSRTGSADFGGIEQFPLICFDYDDNLQSGNPRAEPLTDQRTVASGCQIHDSRVDSSIKARMRWRMAVVLVNKGTVAPGDTHVPKKQRRS